MTQVGQDYHFQGGFPSATTVTLAYDDADLSRAVEAYRFFFPAVSGLAIWKGNLSAGAVPNNVLGLLDTRPEHVGLTLNSDTPYGPFVIDLRSGPLVLDIPAGPLMGVIMDLHQRWLGDLGLPGPDAGQGGRYVLLPPAWTGGALPDGHYVIPSTTYRVIGGVRAIPVGGDLSAAHTLMSRVQLRPLDDHPGDQPGPSWPDMTAKSQDTSPDTWERELEFWAQLHEIIDTEPPNAEHGGFLGLLATLGIERGRPFDPDSRGADVLARAAVLANHQMRVQAFADRRDDRVVWPGTQWEWPALRPENGLFTTAGHVDVDAREKWFFQAIGASPAMFRRGPDAGSVYWLGLRDRDGAYLDGGSHYTLTVPESVPARLFWSITAYDAETRSQVQAPQDRAALRSLFELADVDPTLPVDLYFGPEPPAEGRERWIETVPGRGWFVYFRAYGPDAAAFDGTWSLPDFHRTG